MIVVIGLARRHTHISTQPHTAYITSTVLSDGGLSHRLNVMSPVNNSALHNGDRDRSIDVWAGNRRQTSPSSTASVQVL